MRANRLISLLLLLQNHNRLSVAELARRLEVSTRTVLRDVDALSGLGIPVYADRGRAGGIRLMAGYAADLHAMSPLEAEAMALVSTPAIVAGFGLEKPLASALQKITAAVPAVHQLHAQHARHRLLFDATPWFHRSPVPPVLERLRTAIWANHRCRLDYRRADGIAKGYLIKPYALVAKVDTWYLVADTSRGMRVFRVQRIQDAAALDESFQRDANFDLQQFWSAWCKRFEADPGNRFVVDFWITREGRALLLENYGAWHAAALAACDDALPRCRVVIDFEREDIAMKAFFELGGEASIIRPRALRAKLLRHARAVIAGCGAAPD
jgi:predicted DNA-binding transcriptional regulator YafY